MTQPATPRDGLHQAARRGDAELLRELLRDPRVNPNQQEEAFGASSKRISLL